MTFNSIDPESLRTTVMWLSTNTQLCFCMFRWSLHPWGLWSSTARRPHQSRHVIKPSTRVVSETLTLHLLYFFQYFCLSGLKVPRLQPSQPPSSRLNFHEAERQNQSCRWDVSGVKRLLRPPHRTKMVHQKKGTKMSAMEPLKSRSLFGFCFLKPSDPSKDFFYFCISESHAHLFS